MTTVYQSLPTEGARATHVLLIGVGAYPHLLGGSGPLASNPFGLRQLESPPISARALAQWFIARQLDPAQTIGFNNPEAPLASVEMLLSQGSGRTAFADKTVDRASLENIQLAFRTWVERLRTDSGSTGVFYFCGHGVTTEFQYLLAEDFGEDADQPWRRSFDVSNTVRALSREIAGPLYVFIDACQAFSRDLALSLGAPSSPLLSRRLDDRQVNAGTLVVRGTKEGEKAFSTPGEVSIFTRALLRSLSGFAGLKLAGQNLWAVTASELARSIFILSANDKVDALRQQAEYELSGQNTVLRYETQPTRDFIELNIEIWTEKLSRLTGTLGAPRAMGPSAPRAKQATEKIGAKVFINCAEADLPVGQDLFQDLKKGRHRPWLAAESLVPGQNRRSAIENAIRSCDLFLALGSKSSHKEIGYFRVELKKAFGLLEEMPPDSVFVVPARIDDCELEGGLKELFPVDLFPTYEIGLAKLLKTIDNVIGTHA